MSNTSLSYSIRLDIIWYFLTIFCDQTWNNIENWMKLFGKSCQVIITYNISLITFSRVVYLVTGLLNRIYFCKVNHKSGSESSGSIPNSAGHDFNIKAKDGNRYLSSIIRHWRQCLRKTNIPQISRINRNVHGLLIRAIRIQL